MKKLADDRDNIINKKENKNKGAVISCDHEITALLISTSYCLVNSDKHRRWIHQYWTGWFHILAGICHESDRGVLQTV